MKVTALTRRRLAERREERKLLKDGYRRHETDWEIHRGGRHKEIIIDCKISVCGKYIYTKLGMPRSAYEMQEKKWWPK